METVCTQDAAQNRTRAVKGRCRFALITSLQTFGRPFLFCFELALNLATSDLNGQSELESAIS